MNARGTFTHRVGPYPTRIYHTPEWGVVDSRNLPLRWLYYYAKLDISISNDMIQRIHTVPEISDPLPSRHWCSGKVVDVDPYKFSPPLVRLPRKNLVDPDFVGGRGVPEKKICRCLRQKSTAVFANPMFAV